jgi:hypothetical protein
MKNARATVLGYLDAKQHLWNTYFVNRFGDLRECEPLDSFEAIDQVLFKSLVCDVLGINLANQYILGSEPVPEIVVVPKPELSEVSVMVGKLSADRNRYWEVGERFAAVGIECQFIEFFQWNRYDYLSMSQLRCRITNFPPNPGVVGRDAILNIGDVDFFASDTPGRD